jgi:hypothetical protein
MDHAEIINKLKELKHNEVAKIHLEQLEGIDDDTTDKIKTRFVENAKKFLESYKPPPKEKYYEGNFTKLAEAKFGKDGAFPIKIIQPGWGSSGYYPKEVLQRDAKIYKEGTKMYWNHPTITEEMERPERSLNDLAGVLVSEGKYEEQGIYGAGVYAMAKPFSQFSEKIVEMAPHIGLSHIAKGKANFGNQEGKAGDIIEGLTYAESVDFVTEPGAGGAVIQLFESARTYTSDSTGNYTNNTNQNNKKMAEIKEKDFNDLKEAKATLETENQKLRERIVLREAKEFVSAEIKEADLPDITKERLIDQLSKNPITKEGELDKDAYKVKIKEAVDEEIKYLADLSESGKITGINSKDGNQGEKFDEKKYAEDLKAGFIEMGYSEEQAEIMANGRN